MKQAVSIELLHQGQTERMSVHLLGEYYEVPPLGYLRYIEKDEQVGETTNTIRLLPDEIRIQRRGAIDSNLTLKPAERTAVTYRVGGYAMQLMAYTKKLEFRWSGSQGSVICEYELWQDEELVETIRLQLNVKTI